MKRNLIVIVGIIILIILFIGGKMYMDSKKLNEEMVKVVYSDEAQSVFENRLRNLDSKALTDEGVIQTYEIDKMSIKHNPMGGINVRLIINKNSELDISYTLNNYNGKLEGGGASISMELSKQLGRWEEYK